MRRLVTVLLLITGLSALACPNCDRTAGDNASTVRQQLMIRDFKQVKDKAMRSLSSTWQELGEFQEKSPYFSKVELQVYRASVERHMDMVVATTNKKELAPVWLDVLNLCMYIDRHVTKTKGGRYVPSN